MDAMGSAPPRTTRTAVREIDETTYWGYLRTSPHAGFQQSPEWGRARSGDWRPELVGWYDDAGVGDDGDLDSGHGRGEGDGGPAGDGGRLLGVALIRYRDLPLVHRSFAIVPQGPVLDWEHGDLPDLLRALGEHARAKHAFALVVVPPLARHHWDAATVKAALAAPETTVWDQVPPDHEDPVGRRAVEALEAGGWHRLDQGGVLDAAQPLFNAWLHLAGRTEEEILAGMTRTWRKNIRRAEREGVEIREGTREDLPAVQRIYSETARRQEFDTHPLQYFEAMWDALAVSGPGRFHLDLAVHEGDVLSAAGTAQAGHRAQGVFAANGSLKRELKASNLLYLARIRHARDDGADDFDLGGVASTLEADGPEAGLLQFKADMGAEFRECIGGWELVLDPFLRTVFTLLLPLHGRARRLADQASRTIRARTW